MDALTDLIDPAKPLLQRLQFACRLASQAYGDPGNWIDVVATTNADYGQLITVQHPEWQVDAQCGVLSNHDVCVIVFRGTPADSLPAWIRNLQATRREFLGGRLHAGILQQWYALERRLFDTLHAINRTKTPTVLIGHSAGGGLAQIEAFSRVRHNEPCQAVYTFGSPRVLNPRAAKYVRHYVDSVYRVVHGNDGVPLLPGFFTSMVPLIRRYQHVGDLVSLGNDSYTLNPTLWAQAKSWLAGYHVGDTIREHYVSAYEATLSQIRSA